MISRLYLQVLEISSPIRQILLSILTTLYTFITLFLFYRRQRKRPRFPGKNELSMGCALTITLKPRQERSEAACEKSFRIAAVRKGLKHQNSWFGSRAFCNRLRGQNPRIPYSIPRPRGAGNLPRTGSSRHSLVYTKAV